MKKIAITVNNLSIKYKIIRKMSLLSTLKNIFNKVENFEAVKNVSFEIENGKVVGIIGKNGSGKSTLLKAIAGVFSPDNGSIDLHNNTCSLMSIGVGFNKKLTGRENIYLSGMLLGFDEKRIDGKINDIINFADIGDFIDKPVKTYSSGMYSKLAFSITAFLDTDIILIDEVLSVGDAKFKEKSFNKIKELILDKNRTVLIVSHDLNTLDELCDEIIWINNGTITMNDKTKKVLKKYEKYMNDDLTKNK